MDFKNDREQQRQLQAGEGVDETDGLRDEVEGGREGVGGRGEQQTETGEEFYRFALCPKSINNVFFDVSRDGCLDRADVLSRSTTNNMQVECLYVGPNITDPDGVLQAEIIRDLLHAHRNGTQVLDGLSISVRSREQLRPVIQDIIAEGLPVVTFDSDDPDSGRASYIGTDNYFFGGQLAKVLHRIHPEGGTFAIMTDSAPNIIEREAGVRDTLLAEQPKGLWTEVPMSPYNIQQNASYAIEMMREIGATIPDITAVIPTMGSPMFQPDEWKSLVDDHRNIIFVVADGLAVQLELLGRNYVHGLVAQLPYAMGSMSVDSLLALAQYQRNERKRGEAQEEERDSECGSSNGPLGFSVCGGADNNDGNAQTYSPLPALLPDIQGTNVLEHLQIPLVLPELTVDNNHLDNLAYVGYSLFGIIAVTCLYFSFWVFRHRAIRVVKASQPEFLYMVCLGSFIMGSSIIPLGYDDSGTHFNEFRGTVICMAPPWLAFSGFTITFSALFAKIWRVNRLLRRTTRSQHARIIVSSREVLTPFFVLFTLNVILLTCWTVLDPLRYTRRNGRGLDPWSRVIETYGVCESETSSSGLPYSIPLACVNALLLLVSNWQAYQARSVSVEFAESTYIGMVLASLLQAAVIGVPLLFLVRDLPKVYFLLLSVLIFVVCMAVLLLIFLPKVVIFSNLSDEEQRTMIQRSVAATAPTARSQHISSVNELDHTNDFSHYQMREAAPAPNHAAVLPTITSSGNDGTDEDETHQKAETDGKD